MKRRTMLMLMLLGLGIASFPQVASAQSSPLIGTWKVNVEKSTSEHAKSTSARRQPGLGGRGGPQPPPAANPGTWNSVVGIQMTSQMEDAIERLMQTTGCSRRRASNIVAAAARFGAMATNNSLTLTCAGNG